MDPHARRACDDCCKRVYVERKDTTKDREHEWVPLQCRKKVTVKELNSAPGHSARDARQTSNLIKKQVRQRKPKGKQRGSKPNRKSQALNQINSRTKSH